MINGKKAQISRGLIIIYCIPVIALMFLVFFFFILKTSILGGYKTDISVKNIKGLSDMSSVLSFLHYPAGDSNLVIDLLANEKYDLFYNQVDKFFGERVKCGLFVNSNRISHICLYGLPESDSQVCTDFFIIGKGGDLKDVSFCIEK